MSKPRHPGGMPRVSPGEETWRVSISVGVSMYDRLYRYASAERVKVPAIVRLAVERFLRDESSIPLNKTL